MMKPNAFIFRLAVVLLVALSFAACRRASAKKMSKSMANYVYAYSSGTQSKTQPVRVRFTSALISVDQIGQTVESSIFDITPSVLGSATWEDAQTLIFKPNPSFTSGESYIGKVNLKKLFKGVPKDAEVFEFDFHCRGFDMEVITGGIQAENSGDVTKQELLGEIVTTDASDAKNIEKTLTAKQNGKALTITWAHNEDGLHHAFRVKGINRGDSEGKVNLEWSGAALGVDDISGNKEVIIPAINAFEPISMNIDEDNTQSIKVSFSDPLSTTQDLKGLIRINDWNGNVRYTVDGNALLIYPSDRLTGSRTLYLDAAIQNIQGKKLKQSATYVVEFNDVKPEVRLVGRGVIMPNSDGLNFPFEAINLNYVDVEIVKIFNNNILQFLQTNDLDGQNELARVGNIIMQKRVSLHAINPKAATDKWTRYGVDLTHLIKKDPAAIYQVRIGFRRSYTSYNCSNSALKDDLKGMVIAKSDDFAESGNDNEGDNNDWEYQKSIFRYGWNGGELGDHNYQEEQNPCSASYYNRDHFVSRNIFASDLGLIAKKGGDGSVFIAVSDLINTTPKSGVKLDFYDYQHQHLATATTNAEGVGIVKEFKGKPWVVVASSGNEKGYLPLSNNNALSLSRFDVAGTTTQKGMKGFLYGERGVWRPGDSLFLNFILEDKDNKLPNDYPITLELYDPKGTLQYRTTTVQNVENIYPFHIATRQDAPTGKWRADVKAGGATFSENIKIETVKPNRLKVNLDFGKKEVLAGQENLSANMQVNWLHGAPARGSKVKIEAVVASVKTEFPKFKDYVFDNPMKSVKSDPSVLFEGNVDDNGNSKVNGTIPKVENAPGKMKIGLKIRAFEPSGDFSSDYRTLDYSPYNTYTGVSVPVNKYGEKRMDINRDGEIAVCVVDKDGTPLRNRTVTAKVYRVEWRWWWETGSDDEAQFTSSKDLTAETEQQLTTNGQGLAYVKVKVSRWGRYFVYAGDETSGHFTGDFFYSGYPWDDEENGSMSRNNAAMLSFSSNKTQYKTGDMVELNIPTPESGKALVSIENGSKVLESKWVSTRSGMTKYTFKATSDMAPTVYAYVTLVQPHNNKNNDLPMRMYGVTPINVEDPKTKLEPLVDLPAELKPEQTVAVQVREKSGKAMAYTIALVDDGLLDLTHFETPNPWNTFYAREALGVQTFDVYDQVLGAYSGKLQRILNIGGDKAGKPKNAQTAMRFKPVVMNLGPFYLKGGSVGRHNITIPNYVGSVRAMVVAASNGAYGKADKTVPVRKPLMVLATLPRVLSPKETLKLPVNVFAMTGKVKNATISVIESSGLIQFNGQTSKSVTFSQPSDKMVDFDLTVNEGIGIAKFKIIAEGGGEKTTQDIEIDVRNPNPVATDIKNAVVQAGESYNLNYQPLGVNGTNSATLEVSTIPPIDLESRLQYLLQYPYGCVEQTTSSAFPQLYVDKLMNLDDAKKKFINTNIKAALDRLKMFQTPTGGFGYWQGEDYPDVWATNYVGHFLLEAKQLGYTLPPLMLENWIKHQQQIAKRWSPTPQNTEGGIWQAESRDLTQAYRLYTLALSKNPEVGAMNILREKSNLPTAARWALASAYSMAGKPEIAKQLVNGIATSVPKYREISYTFGSELRDQAIVLESLVLMGNTNQAIQVARDVSQKLSSGDWYGTQSVAYGLMAMAKFAGKTQAGSEFAFGYAFNGKTGNFKSTAPIAQIQMPVNATNTFSVKNTGKSPLFVRVILRGKPAVGATNDQPIASNLNMKIEYKTTKGEPLNPTTLRQGTDFIAEVTLSNPSTLGKNYKEMALTQVFPSGWEILNSRMDKVQGWNNTTVPRYQDVRDDRVNTFFDLPIGKVHTYRVQLNAAYIGRYYLPAQQCEAMYDNSITARQIGRWVEVTSGDRKVM